MSQAVGRATLSALPLLAILALGQDARAESPAELRRLFPFEAKITADEAALVRLILPPDVLKASRADEVPLVTLHRSQLPGAICVRPRFCKLVQPERELSEVGRAQLARRVSMRASWA